MSEFLVSPCFPYFLKSCISSKRQGKQTCIYFLSTIKKILVRCQIPENKHVPYTGPPIICEHCFFHAKPLSCTFCNLRRRSEIGTSHVAQQDPASWKVHVSIIYACFGPAMGYRLVLFEHVWCFQQKKWKIHVCGHGFQEELFRLFQ